MCLGSEEMRAKSLDLKKQSPGYTPKVAICIYLPERLLIYRPPLWFYSPAPSRPPSEKVLPRVDIYNLY